MLVCCHSSPSSTLQAYASACAVAAHQLSAALVRLLTRGGLLVSGSYMIPVVRTNVTNESIMLPMLSHMVQHRKYCSRLFMDCPAMFYGGNASAVLNCLVRVKPRTA